MRQRSPGVRLDFVEVPEDIYERNKKILLALDVMKVNGLLFVVSASLRIDLVTAKFTPEMKTAQLPAGVARAI